VNVPSVDVNEPSPDVLPAEALNDLESLVTEWLSLPEVAQRLDVDLARVRRLLQDHALIAVRRGHPAAAGVPSDLLPAGRLLPDLQGTVTVLLDSGFDAVSALAWLLTPDDSLPGTPLASLVAGRKTEIRRRAQALAR
jgi:Rv2175c C-terminal domain of unknown function